jgi:hypothetical protein
LLFYIQTCIIRYEVRGETKTPTHGVGVRDDSALGKLDFIEGLQALGTHVELASLAIHHHRPFSHIRPKLAIGVPFGKAHIMPELRTLAAHFTLSH